MIVSFLMAGLLSFLGFFSFFEFFNLAKVEGETQKVSLFRYMLGTSDNNLWILLLIQIILVILAIVLWVMIFKDESSDGPIMVVSIVLAVFALIMMFACLDASSLAKLEVEAPGHSHLHNALLQFASILLVIAGILIHFKGDVRTPVRRPVRSHSTIRRTTTYKTGTKVITSSTSKMDKLKLYESQLNSGLITKEEFELKKKQLNDQK